MSVQMSDDVKITSKKLVTLGVIMFAACLTQVASDVYAPSLPTITKVFATSESYAQFSMAIYMIAVALSQIVYGPVSEGVGRRKPLLFGMALMTVGSVVCSIATIIEILIAGRFLQGLGAGGCSCLWRAIYRDAFDVHEMAKYGSYIVIFIMFIIPAAPALGGYFEENISWHANFVFMTGYSIIAMLAVYLLLQETSKYHHPERLKLPYMFKTAKKVLVHPRFIGISLAVFLTYGAMFCFMVKGPILLIDKLNVTPQEFGVLSFISCIIGYSLGGFVNAKLGRKIGYVTMLRIGWCISIASGLYMMLWYLLYGLDLYNIVASITIFYFGSTLIWPNANALAFEPMAKVAGYASTVYSSLQVGGAGVMAALISQLPTTPFVLGVFIMTASLLALILFECVKNSEGEIE
jgi:DHA1 family bicyclomycin/chloramphenicol resistance-like MFS transporter/DHA1 family 2-module integral membrane pump EmrD-like MFS transporter